MGRPSDYSEEIADLICERLASGESLNKMCKEESMPGISTVFRWLTIHQSFKDKYALARESQADALFDEILAISDEREIIEETTVDGEIVVKFDSTAVQRNRLRVDVRKWMAGKLRPKKYGERIALAGDEEAPLIPPTITFSRAG